MSSMRQTLGQAMPVLIASGWLTILMAGAAWAEDIQWLRSAEQAASIAAQSGKPILVYVRSANCHYCDLMQTNVWQDPETVATVMRRRPSAAVICAW